LFRVPFAEVVSMDLAKNREQWLGFAD
jgi:hypothetical protein